ncbi:MAG: hypothetical protein GY928_24090 [Colwellia sp.]|nr:hypothetical protein [Colwellia sp.]
MSRIRIRVYVDGVFSHTDYRKDVFSTRSTVICKGLIYKVKTKDCGDHLRVDLTRATKENFKGGE